MRISMIGPVYPYRGGISQFTTSLAQELISSGSDVQVISFQRQYPGWLYPGQSDKDPSTQHEQVPASYVLDPMYPWTWIRAVKQIASFRPDIVIIQWWTTFWAPAYLWICRALHNRKIKCVFAIHNVVPHEKRLLDVWLARQVLSQGKAFITLSPNESSRLRELIPGGQIYQAALPVPRSIQYGKNPDAVRCEMGIDLERKVLIFFGIVRPYKGLRVLIEALGVLKTEGMTPLLLVVGEFWENVEEYRRTIKQLGLDDQVIIENRFVPNEELGRFFAAADAFVAPYTSGTQSAAIKTAMSFGLPVLASDQIAGDVIGGMHPVTLHRAGDVEDLTDSIRQFLAADRSTHVVTPADTNWQDLIKQVGQVVRDVAPCGESYGKR